MKIIFDNIALQFIQLIMTQIYFHLVITQDITLFQENRQLMCHLSESTYSLLQLVFLAKMYQCLIILHLLKARLVILSFLLLAMNRLQHTTFTTTRLRSETQLSIGRTKYCDRGLHEHQLPHHLWLAQMDWRFTHLFYMDLHLYLFILLLLSYRLEKY